MLESLPKIIGDDLQRIINKSGFSSTAKITCAETSKISDVSWSYKIEIIESDDKQQNLFIKILNEKSDKNEIVFYNEILNTFKSLNNNDIIDYVPHCLNVVHNDKLSFIIMNDLMSEGFTPLDIKESLSVECARTILQQLGRFHAFSFAMRDQRPRDFADATSKIRETVFKSDDTQQQFYRKLFINSIHDALKLAKQSLPSDSVYVEKFAQFTLNIFERMTSLAVADNEYKVLTHGDLWPNNILFRRTTVGGDDNAIDSAIFVDFQGCRFSSPVHDLMLVLLTALDQHTRELYDDELIRCYHKALCNTLLKLGSDPLRIFPYSALQNQLLEHTQFTLALSLVGMPLYLKDNSTPLPNELVSKFNGDLSNINTVSEFVQEIRSQKSMKCKNKMLEIIMYIVDHGYV